MPIFMDRHRLAGLSAKDVAEAHAQDQAIQEKYRVNYLTYWFNARSGCGYCLVDAPDKETAIRVHAEAHGELPIDIIEVELKAVESFLGRIDDPEAVLLAQQPIAESGTRAILFTDIVNSTGLTAQLGDAGIMEIVRAHDVLVRRELNAHGGREVKHLGDGIMASFADPAGAVRCGCAIQRGATALEALNLRIGIHAGEPVAESNDLFGATVQMAARICQDAAIDAVAISQAVRELVQHEFKLMPLGRRMLKGFPEPAPLFSVDWEL